MRFTQAGWSNGDLDEWTRQCGLTDVVRSVGRLPQPDVAALLDSASVLIAVDYARPDSTTLLSKLPDYVIPRDVRFSPSLPRRQPWDACLRRWRGLTARYDSPEDVADRIGAFMRRGGRAAHAFLPVRDVVRLFSPDRVLAELAGACLSPDGPRLAAPRTGRRLQAARAGRAMNSVVLTRYRPHPPDSGAALRNWQNIRALGRLGPVDVVTVGVEDRPRPSRGFANGRRSRCTNDRGGTA